MESIFKFIIISILILILAGVVYSLWDLVFKDSIDALKTLIQEFQKIKN